MSFHGTEAKLIQLQSEAIRIPLLQKETTWNGYENEFKEAVKSLIPDGVQGMIFGDIYLQEHKDWVDREFLRYLKDNNIDVCGENGEYHTFVTYGPMFRKKIEITKSKTITRDGYWFLDTIEYLLHNIAEPATHRRLRLLGLTSFDSYNKRVSGCGALHLCSNPLLTLRN